MAKYAAKGTKLQIEISTVFTDIPALGDISLSVGQTDLIPATTHDSANSFKEYVNGLKDSDEFVANIIYDPANVVHEKLRASHGGTAENFKLVLPDTGAGTFAFAGLVRNFEIDAPVEGVLSANVTIKPTGSVTFTA